MKSKRPGQRKPCKFFSGESSFEEDPSLNDQPNPFLARLSLTNSENHQIPNPYGDTNISSSGEQSAHVEPTYGNSPFGHESQGGHCVGDPNNGGHEDQSQSQLHQLQLSSSYGEKHFQYEQGPSEGQPSTEPHFQQLLVTNADDIIDLTGSEEDVPSHPPVGSLSENGASSSCFQPQQPPEGVSLQPSSSHLQPSHPLLKDVIEEHLCSQALVDSVFRCVQRKPKRGGSKMNVSGKHDGLEIVTSQNSRPQAGANKEVGTSKRGHKRKERPGRKASTRKKQTLKTHTVKDGPSGNEAASVTANRETGLALLGPCPSNLGGPSRTGAEAIMSSAEARELREKVVVVEQTCAQMTDEMKTMRSIILDLQKKLADKDGVPPELTQAGDVSAVSGVLPSTSAQGVPSDKKQKVKQSRNTTKRLQRKR